MAENQEDRSREDLTEEASPHRIDEFRRRGQVAQSKEVAGLAALVATGVAAYAITPGLGTQMADFMREVFRTDLSSRVDLGSAHLVGNYFLKALKIAASVGLPICLAGFFIGALGSFAQIGSVFSADPVTPDLSRLNPLKGLQRIVSIRQLIESFRLILKMVVLLAISYAWVKNEVLISSSHLAESPATVAASFGRSAKVIFLSLAGALGIFAVFDFFLQRWEFSKSIRMTKQEAKQEHKEREGDPQIKARIRSVQREMARRRMMQAVKKADVVVTNPNHIAVALIYDKKSMMAPKVIAKGADLIAQKIKAIAAESGVPMVENVPLARTLFRTVKVGQFVPRPLYQAVAEVLAYVYRLKNRGSEGDKS